MITVLVVDDQPLQRFGFRMLLESTPDTEIVGEAENGAEAVRRTTELHPDVVLMDIRMPGVDGIEATRRIAAAGGRSRILVLTTFDVDRYALAALRAGASGFLLKDARPEELLAGIRAVAAGDAVIAPALTRRLLDGFADRLDDDQCGPVQGDPRLDSLTGREHEIFDGARAPRGTPQSPELREVRRELKELAAEQATLLAQVRQEETTLRAEQSQLDRNRTSITAQRGKRALPKVTTAEKRVRGKLATLASERAWLDGTVQHDREQATIDNAIWNSAHDPETFGSDDW